MTQQKPISVGVVGTSWWADAMYLPALHNHPLAQINAICGRNREPAEKMAARWHIPHIFTDYNTLFEQGGLDAVIIASGNESHYPITMKALEAGIHVLCEKPLALTYAQAAEMAAFADQQSLKHMVPFTYRYMPNNRYLKELVESGYIGQPYHLNLRYYTGYGRTPGYNWRFDMGKAGSGAIGDIGSHFLHLATWWFGEITEVSCQLGHMLERAPLDPSGNPYTVSDDTCILTLTFANGAQGVLHISTMAHTPTSFGQTHHAELHGSEGSLYSFIDWDTVQQITGARKEDNSLHELPIPDHIWGKARRDTVHNTYRDMFREHDFMAREFITAIAEDMPVVPSFHDGAYIQQLIEAALLSDQERRWVKIG